MVFISGSGMTKRLTGIDSKVSHEAHLKTKMRLLLLGAEGQLGHSLQQLMVTDSAFEVLAVGRGELDICDANVLAAIFGRYQPEFVINCAAYTWVDGAESEPESCYNVNAFAVKSLAELCQLNDCVLIHLSTDYVFDGASASPYREEDEPHPLNVYGQSKLLGEQYVHRGCRKHLIIRTASLFSDAAGNFVTTILAKARQGTPLTIVSDQYSGPTFANDLARVILRMMKTIQLQGRTFSQWGIYHYCGEPEISWYDFALKIFEHQLPKVQQVDCQPILLSHLNTAANRPQKSMLDNRRIKTTFGVSASDWLSAIKQENFTQ